MRSCDCLCGFCDAGDWAVAALQSASPAGLEDHPQVGATCDGDVGGLTLLLGVRGRVLRSAGNSERERGLVVLWRGFKVVRMSIPGVIVGIGERRRFVVSGIGWGMCTDRGSASSVAMREIGVLGLVRWGSKWSSCIHA